MQLLLWSVIAILSGVNRVSPRKSHTMSLCRDVALVVCVITGLLIQLLLAAASSCLTFPLPQWHFLAFLKQLIRILPQDCIISGSLNLMKSETPAVSHVSLSTVGSLTIVPFPKHHWYFLTQSWNPRTKFIGMGDTTIAHRASITTTVTHGIH